MTFQYKFKGTTLMEEKTTKYRGVDLQANLAWNHHINHHINRVTKTKKTNSMLGVLRRNLRYASEKNQDSGIRFHGQVKPGLLLYHLESLPSGPETPSGDGPAQGGTFCDKQVQKHELCNRHARLPFLAYPTRFSAIFTGIRNSRLTREGIRRFLSRDIIHVQLHVSKDIGQRQDKICWYHFAHC